MSSRPPSRSYRPPLLATAALTALAAALLAPLLPQEGPLDAAPALRPSVQVSALPAEAATAKQDAPVRPALDVAALVADQRAKGLDCSVTQASLPVCTHGGDAHLRSLPSLVTAAAGGASGSTAGTRIGCYGDGADGHRVQAVYARPDGSADRYASVLPNLRRYAAGIDTAFDKAAQTTKGRRHVRFVTTPACDLDVVRTVLPTSAFRSMTSLVDALQVKGFQQSSRAYLVWADASVLCGIATMYVDDSPRLDNLNNGAMPSYARVDRPCWGKAEVHELVHAFGGIQPSAPNSTGGYHCSDGADVMCYDDKSARSTQRSVCPASSAQVLDCRHDDYFSTAAPRGSYLQTRWNVARSSFLTSVWDAPAPSASPSPAGGSQPAEATPPPAPQPSATPSQSAAPSPTASPTGPAPGGGGLALPLLPPLPTLPPPPAPLWQPAATADAAPLPTELSRAGAGALAGLLVVLRTWGRA